MTTNRHAGAVKELDQFRPCAGQVQCQRTPDQHRKYFLEQQQVGSHLPGLYEHAPQQKEKHADQDHCTGQGHCNFQDIESGMPGCANRTRQQQQGENGDRHQQARGALARQRMRADITGQQALFPAPAQQPAAQHAQSNGQQLPGNHRIADIVPDVRQ